MALPETGIPLLDERNLFLHQADAALGMSPFQDQPPLVTAAQLVLGEDFLDRNTRDGDAVRLEQRFLSVASPAERFRPDRRIFLTALGVDWGWLLWIGEVFVSFDTMRLEAPFTLVNWVRGMPRQR